MQRPQPMRETSFDETEPLLIHKPHTLYSSISTNDSSDSGIENVATPGVASHSSSSSVVEVVHKPAPVVVSTPLPMRQLSILFLIRLAEPINYTIIFPFVNQMMEDLKVADKPSEIGFYSGLVDSMFSVAQCCTILQWGRLSDRIGRRPVIFIGLAGSVAAISLFGLSKDLAWALTSRTVAGVLSGNIAVIQSILAEITDPTNEAKAMPLTSLTWSLGCVIGPIIGGNLQHPAERWPSTPFNNALFREYPYLFPCVVGASIGLCALFLAYWGLKETRPRRKRTLSESSSSSTITLVEELSTQPPPKTVREMLMYGPLQLVMASGFLISLLATAYDAVFALVCFTPIELGGLSLSPAEIGYALAFGGLVSITVLPTGLPILKERLGTTRLYNYLTILWPIIFLCFPLLNVLARLLLASTNDGSSTATVDGQAKYLLWIGICTMTFLSRIANMVFSLNVMLVKAAAPDKAMLGSTYGVSQTIGCIARAIGPAFVSTLFAVSVDQQLLHGHAVWFIMAGIGACSVIASRRLSALNL